MNGAKFLFRGVFTFKKPLLVSTLCLVSLVLAAEPTPVRLGTATKGGGFQLYGQAVAEVINEMDNSMHVMALPTKGSKENLPLLEAGELDIGLVEGNAARQAIEGIGRPPAELKIFAAMYPNPGMFVVRADRLFKTIDDLRGERIAWGTKASGLRILANDVMDGIGLDPRRDFKSVILNKAAHGPILVLKGSVAALWGGGIGWPGFKKVADSPQGARFIAPSKDEIRRIQAKHPHLRSMTVPAGTYAGQTQPIESVGLWALILVRPSLDDDVVYRLTRALHKGEGELAERLVQGRYTTIANTVAEAPRPQLIHPGAMRYMREIGALK